VVFWVVDPSVRLLIATLMINKLRRQLSYSHLRLYTDIGKIITDDSEYYDMEWNELFVYIGVSIWLVYIYWGEL